MDVQSKQEEGSKGIRRQLAADAHLDASRPGHPGYLVELAHHGRMEGVEKLRQAVTGPVHGESVLNQIVRAD